MKVEGINAFDSFSSSQKTVSAAEEVERQRKEADFSDQKAEKQQKSPPTEEIMNRIKEITQDGVYSVRFETDDATEKLVVRIVDQESGDVIRQIPPEDLLGLTKRLEDLRGNIIQTEG